MKGKTALAAVFCALVLSAQSQVPTFEPVVMGCYEGEYRTR